MSPDEDRDSLDDGDPASDDRTAGDGDPSDGAPGDRRLHDRVREDVDGRLDRLRDRFGPFPVVETTVENDSDRFETGVEMAREGWRGDAGALVRDADGRVLLIRHEAADGWGEPGGGHEPGESFPETARREVREETGVEADLTGVLRARRKTFVHADDPDRRMEMLTVWFEGRTDRSAPAIDIGDDEIEAARWFEEPPETVADRVAEWAGTNGD